jgi:hypothetical protein
VTTHTSGRRVDRAARLGWVPLALMRVSPLAQRDLNPARVKTLVAEFDLDQIGILTVSKRDGYFWIIDGQHRKAALVEIGYGDQQVQCDVYEGLTEADEAEMFLRRNNTLTVTSYSKFKVGVRAGRPDEVAIDRTVRALGLRVSNGTAVGSISAVGTLRKVFTRDGNDVLRRALAIIRDAYGDAGLSANVIDGIGMLVHRYDGVIRDTEAVAKLRTAPGGVVGLTNRAEVVYRATGSQRPHCIAAAAVELINRGQGGKKLAKWWQDAEGEVA